MKYVISPLSIVPVRSSPVDTSELCTQLLFGELAEVLELKGKQWLKIRCASDNTIGWAATSQFLQITEAEFQCFQTDFSYNLDLTQPLMATDHFIPITLGAHLPEFDGMRLKLGDQHYQFSGQAVAANAIEAHAEILQKIAKKYLYAPYLHGGRTPFGIDNSGFVQMVFHIIGLNLPRETLLQVEEGDPIDFVEQAKVGDLAFFENRAGRIAHVGIVIPDGQLIHAYGCVRIDQLDHYGIFNTATQKYTHKLRVLRRILPATASIPRKRRNFERPHHYQIELF